jgi:glucose/arabinose dehydrogenase
MTRRGGHRARVAALWTFVVGCGGGPTTPAPQPTPDLVAVQIVAGLAQPVHVVALPGDDRLFVVEQPGRIRIVANGMVLAQPFLDITDRVVAGGERGLLSVALHPDYAANGRFYVNYTGAGGHTRVERYHVTADPNVADPASASLVIGIEQPLSNHNGGQIAFGPDGMLYIGMGDGGGGGDPLGHGQNHATLHGALLRIDVDAAEPYEVPADNPFVGTPGAAPEIWAIGLRNPWRFSFDFGTGMLYIADVGQNHFEEINVQPASAPALNYGWNIMEGASCFPPGTSCDATGLVLPALAYPHPQGCSVTGGHVYRGAAMPALHGHYFYGDYCAGWIRSFRHTPAGVTDEREWTMPPLGNITTFGLDADGELIVAVHGGVVFRLVPAPGFGVR